MKTIYQIKDLPFGIELLQSDDGETFSVVYGKHIASGLTHDQACVELGNCVFHALACDGFLYRGEDNHHA